MKYQLHFTETRKDIENLGSALTFEGLKYHDENLDQLFNWIEKYTPVKTKQVYITRGRIMNEACNTKGVNRYPDDLSIVSVRLEDIEKPDKLIIPKIQVGARWMDDILENCSRKW